MGFDSSSPYSHSHIIMTRTLSTVTRFFPVLPERIMYNTAYGYDEMNEDYSMHSVLPPSHGQYSAFVLAIAQGVPAS